MFLLKLSGPVHTVFTVTGTSTDGLNSTVQVRVTSLPTVMIPGGLLVTLTVGVGTTQREYNAQHQYVRKPLESLKLTSQNNIH